MDMAADFWLDQGGVLRRRWRRPVSRTPGTSAAALLAAEHTHDRGCIVVPPTLRGGVMALVHGQGHYGGQETARRVQIDFWWATVTADVLHYVAACGTCGVMKHSQASARVPIGVMERPTEGGRVGCCDTVGPFTKSS